MASSEKEESKKDTLPEEENKEEKEEKEAVAPKAESEPKPEPTPSSSAVSRPIGNITTKVLLVVLLIIASLNLYYSWRANKTAATTTATDETSGKTTADDASATETTSVSATSAKTTASKASVTFESALNAKDYDAMKPLLASTVNFILDASECCGDITADKTIAQLKSRLSDASTDTYNFSSSQQIVQKMKTNLPESFSKWNNIGISNGKDYLAYNVDANGKVSEIIMGFTDSLDLE